MSMIRMSCDEIACNHKFQFIVLKTVESQRSYIKNWPHFFLLKYYDFMSVTMFLCLSVGGRLTYRRQGRWTIIKKKFAEQKKTQLLKKSCENFGTK